MVDDKVGVSSNTKACGAVSDWRNLFAAPKKSFFKLEYCAPKVVDGKVSVDIPDSVVELGVQVWEGALVGQFIDRTPSFFEIQRTVQNLWSKNGRVRISSMDNGLYLFRFDNERTRDWVSEVGMWTMGGMPMVVSRWRQGIEPINYKLNSLPMWVKFRNVPPEHWTEKGISYIASAVGIPLYTDAAAEEGSQMGFLKVCVEVSVDSILPKTFVANYAGVSATISVEYPWRPLRCMDCKIFGHSTENCKGKQKKKVQKSFRQENETRKVKVWVPKVVDEKSGGGVKLGDILRKEVDVEIEVCATGAIDGETTSCVNATNDDESAVGLIEVVESQAEVTVGQFHVNKEVALGNNFAVLAEEEVLAEVDMDIDMEETAAIMPIVKHKGLLTPKSTSSESSPEVLGFRGLKKIDEVEMSKMKNKKKVQSSSKKKLSM